MSASDRLPTIEQYLSESLYKSGVMASAVNDVDWLVAEVNRLRDIEQAAVWYVRYGGNGHIENLHGVVTKSARPELLK
jgi:hypothetical protein